MKLAANITSILFHPLLMVTYGVLLALNYTYLAIYPTTMKLYLAGGALLCTAVIPGLLILLMVKGGGASDLELTDKRERAVPYLICITANMTCLFYLFKMQMPFWLLSMFSGVCLSLFIALLINFAWKISVHAIGIGGLLGAVMGVALIQMTNPCWLFISILLASGAVCTSRIILKKHTPMQTYTGFGLGFICTFGATFTSFIYLLIQ
jgi:membrane-associated phospholipid phosphatase